MKKHLNLDIPNIVTSSPVKFYTNLASASYGNSSFQVKVNQQTVGNVTFLLYQIYV